MNFSGALHGLMRVRSFTQDDSHIFMTPDQVQDEIIGVVNLIDRFYSKYLVLNMKLNFQLNQKKQLDLKKFGIWQNLHLQVL